MYKISIIGTGYVGLTTGIGLANFGSNVLCVDIEKQKIQKLEQGIMPIYEPGMEELLKENVQKGRLKFSCDIKSGIEWADIIFIAVGTPQGDDGRADLSAVYSVAETIGKCINGYKIVITKSTVPVGTNEKIKEIITGFNDNSYEFDIVSNPEFLREGKAMYDFLHPDRVIIGTDSPRPLEAVKRIYRPLHLTEVPFIFTDYRTAELIKYSANCFLAMKVAFINEMARLCDTIGANVQTLASAVGKDGRIGSKFLHAGPGFGGSCFPKDTQALAVFAREAGMQMKLVESTIESNKLQKLYIADKIKQAFSKFNKDVTLGILGLAFKADTDDMREASSITVINELLKGEVSIKVYDPQAMPNAMKIWGGRICFASDEYDAVSGADGIIILTEWNQFRLLDLERVKKSMKGNVFFDFRNIYKPEEIEASGLVYIGMGQ